MKVIKLPIFGIVLHLEGKGGKITSDLCEDDAPIEYNISMDTIERVILAHACTGVDVESPTYLEGIEAAAEVCAEDCGWGVEEEPSWAPGDPFRCEERQGPVF